MRGLSLVVASRGPLFIAVRGPLTVVASRCGAQAPDAQAQYLWVTGLVAPWHVGSSQTRARTHVPGIGRQILNHCATREALKKDFKTRIIKQGAQYISCLLKKAFVHSSFVSHHPGC